MPISRRRALPVSGSALTGMSLGSLTGERRLVRCGQTAQEFPQVPLARLMNGDPIPQDHGAPLHLIVPFRYGNGASKS